MFSKELLTLHSTTRERKYEIFKKSVYSSIQSTDDVSRYDNNNFSNEKVLQLIHQMSKDDVSRCFFSFFRQRYYRPHRRYNRKPQYGWNIYICRRIVATSVMDILLLSITLKMIIMILHFLIFCNQIIIDMKK